MSEYPIRNRKMKSVSSLFPSVFFSLLVCAVTLLSSCKNSEPGQEKLQKVIVYTDHYISRDSVLFKRFEQTHRIKVYVKYIHRDSILSVIKDEKYNSYADLILLQGADIMRKAEHQKILRPFSFDEKVYNIEKEYTSRYHNWIALSKDPVIIAHIPGKTATDTLVYFSDVLKERWKGKVALQSDGSSTLQTLLKGLEAMKSPRLYLYGSFLKKQATLPRQGSDLDQLKRIRSGKAEIAFVSLSSVIEAQQTSIDSTGNSAFNTIIPVFPGQPHKGTFYNITSGGIYRYARNIENADKLLEYLSSTGQAEFASNRMEFPVKPNTKIADPLQIYGKYKARFINHQYR